MVVLRIFRSSPPMSENILYLVREEDAADFPGDTYASICQAPIPGAADHITVPGLTDAQVLDRAMALFSRCREQEQLLDELVFQGVTLQQLCESGAELLDNPVYIHDDWFMMLAQSSQVDDILTPEYTMTSQRGFLPRVIVDDLQFDSDYLETYTTHDVQLWHSSSKTADCIYVNLWDGAVYRGRLLVMETNHPFRPSDYRLAEVLAQRAMSCLHYRASTGEYNYSGAYTDYAKPVTGGNGKAETDIYGNELVNFVNDSVVVENEVTNFAPKSIAKITVVIWLEGDDADCNDDALGGQFKADMSFAVVGGTEE